jgi:hypothetical protein
MNKETYIVLYKDEHISQEWTLEEIIEYINQDRSERWTDYDETDWKEGWNEWVEPEGFYTLLDNEDEYCIIEAEHGDDDNFQIYCYEDGTRVPQDEPVGIEHNENFYIFSHIKFA